MASKATQTRLPEERTDQQLPSTLQEIHTLVHELDQAHRDWENYARRADTPPGIVEAPPEHLGRLRESVWRFFGGTTYHLDLVIGLQGALMLEESEHGIFDTGITLTREGVLEDTPSMKDQVQWLTLSVSIEIGVPHLLAMNKLCRELLAFKSLRGLKVIIFSQIRGQDSILSDRMEWIVSNARQRVVEIEMTALRTEMEREEEDVAARAGEMKGPGANPYFNRLNQWTYHQAGLDMSRIWREGGERVRYDGGIEVLHERTSRTIFHHALLVDAISKLPNT